MANPSELRTQSSSEPLVSFGLVSGYNPTIDYLRFIAAIQIVLFHANAPLGSWGQASVGFFITIMTWFLLKGLARDSVDLSAYVKSRSAKMLYPFLVWNIIYIAAKAGDAAVTGSSFSTELFKWLPPLGTFGQLWFLLWAVAIVVLLAGLSRGIRFDHSSPASRIGWSATLVVVSVICLWVWTALQLPLILAMGILYIPSVFVGIVLFQVRSSVAMICTFGATICLFGLILGKLGLDGTQQLTIGAPVMAASLLIKTPGVAWAKRLGVMSMDIYLVHILVLAIVASILKIPVVTPLGSALAVILSIALASLLQIPRIGNALR